MAVCGSDIRSVYCLYALQCTRIYWRVLQVLQMHTGGICIALHWYVLAGIAHWRDCIALHWCTTCWQAVTHRGAAAFSPLLNAFKYILVQFSWVESNHVQLASEICIHHFLCKSFTASSKSQSWEEQSPQCQSWEQYFEMSKLRAIFPKVSAESNLSRTGNCCVTDPTSSPGPIYVTDPTETALLSQYLLIFLSSSTNHQRKIQGTIWWRDEQAKLCIVKRWCVASMLWNCQGIVGWEEIHQVSLRLVLRLASKACQARAG